MDGAALIVLGLIGLAIAWACWTGRWRAWSKIAVMPHMPVTLLPAVGVCLVLCGIGTLAGGALRGVCIGLGILAAVAGAVVALWGPEWAGPRWFRERDRTYDLSVPLNAAVASSVRTDPGERASAAIARTKMGGREPDARWRAHLVSAEHGHPSAMQREGIVRGHLLLYPDALVFAADVREDRMRGRPVVEVIPASAIHAVRRAPAGAQPDGSRAGSDLPSRVMPRLRLETDTGPVVFETASAARRASELDRRYAREPVG